MNIQITARPVTSTAALMAEYAAVRRRLWGIAPPKCKPVAPGTLQTPVMTTSRIRPEKLKFLDAHVKAFRRWQMISTNGPCSAHLLMRCTEEGISYELMAGPNRQRNIVHFRQKLMWEIKTIVKPSITWPELGRLFGGRDHTTALHGVRAHAARINGREG